MVTAGWDPPKTDLPGAIAHGALLGLKMRQLAQEKELQTAQIDAQKARLKDTKMANMMSAVQSIPTSSLPERNAIRAYLGSLAEDDFKESGANGGVFSSTLEHLDASDIWNSPVQPKFEQWKMDQVMNQQDTIDQLLVNLVKPDEKGKIPISQALMLIPQFASQIGMDQKETSKMVGEIAQQQQMWEEENKGIEKDSKGLKFIELFGPSGQTISYFKKQNKEKELEERKASAPINQLNPFIEALVNKRSQILSSREKAGKSSLLPPVKGTDEVSDDLNSFRQIQETAGFKELIKSEPNLITAIPNNLVSKNQKDREKAKDLLEKLKLKFQTIGINK